MAVFRCWFPDNGDEEDGEDVSHIQADWAAEEYAEREYSDNDYPNETTVWVRDPDGELTKWTVCAEPSVTFKAVEAKEE